MDVSIVVPAYNEEAVIGDTVERLKKIGRVIVVSDGTDRTAEIARMHGAMVIESQKRLGKGGAIKLGLSSVNAPLAGYVDADMPVGINDIRKLIHMLDRYDMAVASRWKGHASGYPGFRRIGSRLGNMMTRLLLGLRISDTQCGAKFFHSYVIPIALRVRSDWYSFDALFLRDAIQQGMRIAEIGVNWKHGERRPKPRPSDGLLFIKDILRRKLMEV